MDKTGLSATKEYMSVEVWLLHQLKNAIEEGDLKQSNAAIKTLLTIRGVI